MTGIGLGIRCLAQENHMWAWLGVKPVTCWSQVGRPTTATAPGGTSMYGGNDHKDLLGLKYLFLIFIIRP